MAGDPQNDDDLNRAQAHSTDSAPSAPPSGPEGMAAGETHAAAPDTAHAGADDDTATNTGSGRNQPDRSSPPTGVVNTNGYAASPATPSPINSAADPIEAAPPAKGAETVTEGDADDADAAATTAHGSPTKTVVREIVETLLLALLVFLAVRASFQNFKVDGESMMPTLHNGQFMIVNKIVFAQVDAGQISRFIPFLNASPHEKRDVFHGPERGDIVVLVNPGNEKIDLVKRVIGLPGETLQIVDGHVYINDHLLIEPYIKHPWGGSTPKITIPADPPEYFVMGDNRTNSLDSRSNQVGLIPRDLMIGKAMLSYWPLRRFGPAPNASPKLSKTETTPRIAYNGDAPAAGS
jgi:signal peptidase I